MNHLLSTATSREEADRAAAIAVLPIGSFEQHGEYLPLSTDTLIACVIAREIADTYNLMLLPPITISCSHEHAEWPGTVSISARTLDALITDVAASLTARGIDRLLLVNGHGGNYVLTSSDWRQARHVASLSTDNHVDMHAGELETSILLHALPDVVRPGYDAADHEANDRQHLLTLGMRAYTTNGVIGQPSLASQEKGKALLIAFTDLARAHVDALLVRS